MHIQDIISHELERLGRPKVEERLVDQRQHGDQLLKMKDAYWG